MSTSNINFQSASSVKPDLGSALQKNGLSSDKADQVSKEINDVISTKLASSTGKLDAKSVRSAIETQIKSDVDSGKLTQDQADAVTKTLDAIEKQVGQNPPAGGAPNRAAAASSENQSGDSASSNSSDKQSSSSSSKTEKDRTTSVKGNVKTTVITYTDGSKETKTSFVTDAATASSTINNLVASANKDTSAKDQSAAADYLANTLQNGFVTDTKA